MRDTSLSAYRELSESGALAGSRLAAYGLLAVHGPMPLFDFQHHENHKDYGSTLAKRVSELVRLGLAMPVGEIENPRSGRMCTLFDVTSRTSPVRHAFRPKSEVQRLREENRRLRASLEVYAPKQTEMLG